MNWVWSAWSNSADVYTDKYDYNSIQAIFVFKVLLTLNPKGRPGDFQCLPPVWNLRAWSAWSNSADVYTDKYDYNSIQAIFVFKVLLTLNPKGRPGDFQCLPPPVWNLRAVSWIPLFYISSLVLLPSPVALCLILFCFWPIFLTSLNLHFMKGRLLCLALVFLFV